MHKALKFSDSSPGANFKSVLLFNCHSNQMNYNDPTTKAGPERGQLAPGSVLPTWHAVALIRKSEHKHRMIGTDLSLRGCPY